MLPGEIDFLNGYLDGVQERYISFIKNGISYILNNEEIEEWQSTSLFIEEQYNKNIKKKINTLVKNQISNLMKETKETVNNLITKENIK